MRSFVSLPNRDESRRGGAIEGGTHAANKNKRESNLAKQKNRRNARTGDLERVVSQLELGQRRQFEERRRQRARVVGANQVERLQLRPIVAHFSRERNAFFKKNITTTGESNVSSARCFAGPDRSLARSLALTDVVSLHGQRLHVGQAPQLARQHAQVQIRTVVHVQFGQRRAQAQFAWLSGDSVALHTERSAAARQANNNQSSGNQQAIDVQLLQRRQSSELRRQRAADALVVREFQLDQVRQNAKVRREQAAAEDRLAVARNLVGIRQ